MDIKLEEVQTEAEELLFFTDKTRDRSLGTIGHLRMDFGTTGREFYSTWFDHANAEANNPYFKECFDDFINDLRTDVLKSRSDMRKFCHGKDSCRNTHCYTKDCWGFRAFTDKYAFYVRCTPAEGDYDCYVYAYEKDRLINFLAGEKGLPTHCYSILTETGEPIMIRFAEKGYYPIPLPEEYSVSQMNEAIGVSDAQRQAMEAGSLFGWKIPGIDPALYEGKKENNKMKIVIYQVNLDRDDNHIAFEGLDMLEAFQHSREIDSSLYDKVYECETEDHSLEDVYRTFNMDHPDDYRGRSLSVSDVVEVKESDTVEPGFFYCDDVGFVKVDFDPALTAEMKNDRLRVLIVEPEKKPYVKEIDAGLASLQREVDGDIEAFYPVDDDVVYIVNEEGKVNGMPLNRAIRDESGEMIDIIAGTFIIAGLGEESFASLDDKLTEKYAKKFQTPEAFFRLNGTIHAMPIKETKSHSHEDKESR